MAKRNRRPQPPRSAAPARPARRPGPLPAAAAAVALLAAAFALYWGSLRHPLVFDDMVLSEAFLRGYGASGFRFDLRWFAYASFGWTYDIFGLDWPWFRLGNILLHAMTAIMLFLFMARLFHAVLPAPCAGLDPAWLAFFGALLFVLHPLAVYGTAYLVQRSMLMATLFSLLSLRLFLEGLLRAAPAWPWSWSWYMAAAGAFFVAAFSKEHCVMLPAVAAALALLVRGASLKTARALLLPLALLGAVALVVTLKQKGVLGTPYEPFALAALTKLAEAQPHALASAADIYARSIVNQAYLFFQYVALWLLPWPGWMSIDLRPEFPARILAWPQCGGLLLWLAWPGVALRLLMYGGRRGLAGFAMLFPWLFALTEIATVRIQEPFVLYRSYLWMGGLLALLPAALGTLPKRAAIALLCAAAAALVPASLERLASFSSEVRLWDDAVHKIRDDSAPFAERTYRGRAAANYYAGHYTSALQDIDRALAINPRNAVTWMTRGTLHMRSGDTSEALAAFERALALAPHYLEARAQRCLALMRLQRLEAALSDCTQALRIDPYDSRNYIGLGMVQALRGQPAAAETAYRRALQLAPADVDAHYQYGVLLSGSGRNNEAGPHFARACAAGMAPACRRAQSK